MAEHKIHVVIVTPYEVFYDDKVDMVIISSKLGEIGVQPQHTPMMAALTPGEIRLKIDDKPLVAVGTNGYAEVGRDLVVIVVNAAEWAEEIDIPRAEAALARAEERYHDPDIDPQEKNHARHGIERAKARIKTARKYQDQSFSGSSF
jgi:F-type H+-transporting ATPase subunit epsilon